MITPHTESRIFSEYVAKHSAARAAAPVRSFIVHRIYSSVLVNAINEAAARCAAVTSNDPIIYAEEVK